MKAAANSARGRIGSESTLWIVTFVFAGAGATFLGPLLPVLATTWRLHDRQAGLLVSCLFIGSFLGSMLVTSELRRALNVGSCCACAGMLFFAFCVAVDPGVAAAAASLLMMGFGLGQLMSSINLLVGRAPADRRAKSLAGVAAAFCVGAILSPALTSVYIKRWPISLRLALFALLYLLPVLVSNRRELPAPEKGTEAKPRQGLGMQTWHPVWHCIAIFLVYGGTEACIANWIPLFATRYGLGALGRTQLTSSLFWVALSSSRIVMSRGITAKYEEAILRGSITAAVLGLVWLVVFSSPTTLIAMCALEGVCLGPIFPLILSSAIGTGLSERSLGVVLAACGAGGAIFPSLLGLSAAQWSLRGGMLVPVAGLVVLLVLRTKPSQKRFEPHPAVRI